MTYEPLEMSKELILDNLKRFGMVPKKVITLFGRRKKDAAAGDACIRACEKILLSEPENGVAELYIGIILQERNQYAKALPHFVNITERTPLMHPAWQHRGMSEMMLKNFESAQVSFMRLGELDPNHAYPYCLIAMAFYMQGKLDTGLYFIDRIMESDRLDKSEKSLLLFARGMLEEDAGDDHSALLHYIESQMMTKDKSALTGLKIHELASQKAEEEI